MSRKKNPCKYSHIKYQTRLKIIKHVCNEGLTIKRTAQILGLKPSTARMILKRFKDDGIVFERKQERQKRISSDDNVKVEENGNSVQSKSSTDQNQNMENINLNVPIQPQQFPYVPIYYFSIPYWPLQPNNFI